MSTNAVDTIVSSFNSHTKNALGHDASMTLPAINTLKLTPGKDIKEFRNYEDSDRHSIVARHYHLMRTNQTLAFYEKMETKYSGFTHAKMTIWEAFQKLEAYVDSSDPDSSFPNLEHMLQTAEAIRAGGHPDWFQLVGLLHDMGKIQYIWGSKEDGQQGTADGDQWALGGDTWVLGCAFPTEKGSMIFPEFNSLNPDMNNPQYSTKYGIYTPNCGLKNVKIAWGHDEYMYQMLVHNKTSIPKEGLAMIRLHSCYPWHSGGQYRHIMDEDDEDILHWVLEFNQYDLYTKADKRPDVMELWPYYQGIIDKYLPGVLDW